MSRPYALYIFDWDGTMMCTTEAIVESIRYAARRMDYPVPGQSETRSAIGLGRVDTMLRLMPTCPKSRWEEFEAIYREHYLVQESAIGLVPGMRGLLLKIKDVGGRIAIATGKSQRGLQRVLATTDLTALVDGFRVGAFTHPKPSPEMVLELCAQFSIAPERTVMVGDSTLDLEMARRAQVDAVGVTWGACSRKELASLPNAGLADSVEALGELLRLTP